MSADLAIPLEELAATPRPASEIGGKAAGLARVLAARLDVPPAVVVPRGSYDAAAAPLAPPAPVAGGERDELAAAAAERVRQTPLAPALADELVRRARGLGERLVVRSSATAEDGSHTAAPGVFASIAGVTPDGVPGAVARVWASALEPAAWAYLTARGVDPARAGMAVIVQREVPARVRGVAYTRAPSAAPDDPAARADDVAIEAWTEPEETLGWARLSRAGDVRARSASFALAEPEAARVARAAIAAERATAAADRGADVEWVWDGEALWLVQARPIAERADRPGPVPPPEVFAFSADDPDLVWQWDATHNPDPLSPAQIGLIERVDASGELPFRLRVAGGYLYAAPAPGRDEPARTAERASSAGALEALFHREIVPAVDRALAPAERGDADLDTCLAAYEAVCRLYFTDLTPAVERAKRALPDLLARLGWDDADEVAARLASATGRGGFERLLDDVAAGRADRRDLYELADPLSPAWDVAAPTYGEMRAWLDRQVDRRAAARTGRGGPDRADDPAGAIRARVPPGERERLDRCLALARAARGIVEVDDRLFFRAQAAVRRALLALARRWRLRDEADVFYIPLEETVALARRDDPPAPDEAHQRADAARRTIDEQRRWAMPLAVSGGLPRPVRRDRSAPDRWVGRGTGGRARGPVVRIDTLTAAPRSARGAIAVLPAVTPGMVFSLHDARAIVAEHGGLLGHAAAMARELGIPCVVGCRGALRELRDGDEVLVEADGGAVVRVRCAA